MSRLILPAALLATVLPGSVKAQETRYELGQRLRAFEIEWDRVTDPAARQRVLPHLKRATTAFFTFSLEEPARGLDQARHSLATDKEPPADVIWAESCVFKPAQRLVAASEELPFTLEQFYRPKGGMPKGLRLRVSWLSRVMACDIGTLPLKEKLSLQLVPEGDYQLTIEIKRGEKVLASSTQTLSVVNRLKERLEKIEQGAASFADRKTTDSLTAASLATLLNRLALGQTLETNYPAARLLNEAEELLKSLQENRPYYGKDQPAQFWL